MILINLLLLFLFNISWYWGGNNNYLTQSYNEKYGSTYGYDEEGFKKYLAAEQPKTLNELLGGL